MFFDVRSLANDVSGETPFYKMFGRNMSTKLFCLSVGGQGIVYNRSGNVRAEYSKRRAVVRNFRPGELDLLRKDCREPFKFKASYGRLEPTLTKWTWMAEVV